MASEKIHEVGVENFEAEVLKSNVPVVVDFWAVWCGPCRQIAPALEEFASKYDGKVKIAKLNVDDHTAIAQQYKVQSIPAVLMFKGGAVTDQVVGAFKDKIETMIQKAI